MLKFLLGLLIYCLPFSLVSGTALIGINVSLISLLTFFYFIYYKNYVDILNKKILLISIIFFIFYLLINLSSIFSSNYFLSYEYSLLYLRFFVFALGVYIALKNEIIKIKYLIYCFGLIYLFVFFDGFYQYFTGFDIFGYKWDGDRLSGFFGEEKILGSFLSRTYPFFFGLASYYSKNKLIMFFAFLGFILSDVLVVLSGDRTAAFYLLISSIIIVVSIRKFQLIRIFTIVVSSILIVTIINYTPQVKERIYDKTVKEIQKVVVDVENNQTDKENNDFFQNYYFFTAAHHGYLLVSLKMFEANPILGIGPKLYRQECANEIYQINDKNNCNTHPHNTYAQLMAETGLVTTLIVLMIFLYICFKFFIQIINKYLFSKYILSDQNVCFLTCVFITLFPLIPTGNFFGNWLNAIYYLPLGFIMYEITKNNTNENFINN